MMIISSPTEQTAVMASSFSMERAPVVTASIMPASSDTGIKAPDRPPTRLDAMTPPFLTASLSIARVAVVPWAPHCSRPISSRIWATESPTAGVGARDRSTMPKGTPRRRLASRAHQLTHTGDLEGGFLDDVGDFGQWAGSCRHLGKGGTHNTGAGYAHVDDTVGLTHAVEGASHEGVVLRSVAEHHQLGTSRCTPDRR